MAAKHLPKDLYIGLMSGTSLDGIDAVLVRFEEDKPELLHSLCHPLPDNLRQAITTLIQPNWRGSLTTIGEINQQLGKCFAAASNAVLEQADINASQVAAIGSHGQTIWHQPDGQHPFTWQLGDASHIAEQTQITTVADFRSRDMAAGGQGAPLVPAFHRAIMDTQPTESTSVILNIGGIANITVLPPQSVGSTQPSESPEQTFGFDTGPGNTLIDYWTSQHLDTRYDKNGSWAATGQIHDDLLERCLADPYFALAAPKSTGREHFNPTWLTQQLASFEINAASVQTTLTELTAISITDAIQHHAHNIGTVYTCGGGAHNTYLQQRIRSHLPTNVQLTTTQALDIHPDWMEAIAFAWLAKRTLEGKSGNLPAVTGAAGARILGAIYPA